MSITRAFTTKRAKRDSPEAPQRSLTTKQSTGGIRNKISSPVGLISTTNMLSYNAPDIFPSSSPSSASNSASDASDSDHKSISSVSTPPSSPNSEKGTPEPNHLSCYFNTQTTSGGLSTAKSTPDLKDTTVPAPKIPNRAPSHTKRSHESLSQSHKKSASKSSSLSHKASAPAMGHKTSSSAIRTSWQMFNNLHQQAAANKNSYSSQPTSTNATTPPQIHAKQSSISQDSQLQNEAPTKLRLAPVQGLPSNPNQQVPPVQSKARSRSNPRSESQNHNQSQHTVTESSQSYTSHPFGHELAQVTELAEEYSGGKAAFEDEEMQIMAQRGLCRFRAEDYIGEIQGLFVSAFGEAREKATKGIGKAVGGGVGAMWI